VSQRSIIDIGQVVTTVGSRDRHVRSEALNFVEKIDHSVVDICGEKRDPLIMILNTMLKKSLETFCSRLSSRCIFELLVDFQGRIIVMNIHKIILDGSKVSLVAMLNDT
jgi:hypothetical protein